MADTKRLVIDGYGQIELNNVAFRRDGRIEAQCKLDLPEDVKYVENGMLLAVDNVSRTVSLPTADSEFIALNYSAEHIYDERTPGLKNFKLEPGTFLPRLGYLAVGDKFTTNCISFSADTTVDELKEAIKAGSVYGCESTDGSIFCCAKADAEGKKVVLKAVQATTMPDGQFGVKFQVLSC